MHVCTMGTILRDKPIYHALRVPTRGVLDEEVNLGEVMRGSNLSGAADKPCLEFLHLCCQHRIVDRSDLLHLFDVVLVHTALPKTLNDVSDVFQAGLQIWFWIPHR